MRIYEKKFSMTNLTYRILAVDIPPKGITDESVVCLSREKADDSIRTSVHTKDLQTKAN